MKFKFRNLVLIISMFTMLSHQCQGQKKVNPKFMSKSSNDISIESVGFANGLVVKLLFKNNYNFDGSLYIAKPGTKESFYVKINGKKYVLEYFVINELWQNKENIKLKKGESVELFLKFNIEDINFDSFDLIEGDSDGITHRFNFYGIESPSP